MAFAKRAVFSVDRTTRDSKPERELTSASAKLTERYSISLSGFNRRKRQDGEAQNLSYFNNSIVSGKRQGMQQVGRNVICREIAIFRTLRQHAMEYSINDRDRRRTCEHRRHIVQDSVHYRRETAALEQRASRDHLVENGSCGEQVCACIDFSARQLLGRGVLRRTNKGTCLGDGMPAWLL